LFAAAASSFRCCLSARFFIGEAHKLIPGNADFFAKLQNQKYHYPGIVNA